jgi:hypothetical protein
MTVLTFETALLAAEDRKRLLLGNGSGTGSFSY